MSAQDQADHTDHMLPGPLDTEHQLPKGDALVVSPSPEDTPAVPEGQTDSAQPSAASSSPADSAAPVDDPHSSSGNSGGILQQPASDAGTQDESAVGQSHFAAATLAVLTFVAIILLGWMVWRLPFASETNVPSPAAIDTVGQDAAEPVRIGVMLPLTGDAASYGAPLQKVVQLAQKEINDDGGIDNRQIVLEWEDSRCDGTIAKQAAEKLIHEKKIRYLIAGACSSEFLAAAPIAQEKKVLSFSSSATSPKISELGRYVFRTAASDALAGKAAAAYAVNKWGAKSAAVIVESSAYPEALRKVFTEEFTRLGGTIAVDEKFDTGTTDFSDAVIKLQANPPDVIYLVPQTQTPGLLLVSAIQQARLDSKLLTAEVLLLRDTVTKQGNLLEGVTGVEVFFDETREKTQDFSRRYKAEYGLELSAPTYMAGMYDVFYLIREAHQATGGDPDRMSDYFYSLKDWNGAVGEIQFDKNGDPNFSYAIRTINNGEARLVDQYTPENGQ